MRNLNHALNQRDALLLVAAREYLGRDTICEMVLPCLSSELLLERKIARRHLAKVVCSRCDIDIRAMLPHHTNETSASTYVV